MAETTIRILPKAELGAFLNMLQDRCTVYAPVREAAGSPRFAWKLLEKAEDLDYSFGNAVLSPKAFFFPQAECLMRYDESGEDPSTFTEVEPPHDELLLLNVRPCDAAAAAHLDHIFCQDDQTCDPYWQGRRKAVLVATLACNHPCPTCFCTSVNSGPHDRRGSDLHFTDLGDDLAVEAVSGRGSELLDGLVEATDEQLAQIGKLKEDAEQSMAQNMPEELNTGVVAKGELMRLYEGPLWKQLSQTCLGCCVCTYVCPTCHCFDIQDEAANDLQSGRRVRVWTTCMFPVFTVHATGHNPRGQRHDRVRQRFMHKFRYIPEKNPGEIGCVGCGRCIQQCPVDIDIREVVQTMARGLEEEPVESGEESGR